MNKPGFASRSRFLRFTMVTIVLLGLVALLLGLLPLTHAYAQSSASSAVSTTGSTIASIARANVGKGACSTNSAGGSGYYSSCTGFYGGPEYWCSDFAHWVWTQAGVNTSGLTAAAGSFGLYGPLLSTPAVGDAVLFDYNGNGYADHVAIVVSVSNGNIDTISGDWNGENGSENHFAGTSHVVDNGTYSGAPGYKSAMAMTLSGYVAPSGSGGGGGGGGSSAVPAPPGGATPPSGITVPHTEWWVTTDANAPGYGAGQTQDGTLDAGTNYVYCKEWGSKVGSSTAYNHWWMWTDLDTGGQGWISAYYLSLWGNDIAKDNSGTVLPNCWPGGSGSGGSTGTLPGAPGGSATPSGVSFPTTEWWVTTDANAPGYGGGWTQVGTLDAGTNYVYCKEWGAEVGSSTVYNHWWMWTDLDTGGQGWVSAYYLSLWGNDVAKDNSGNVIPGCWGIPAPPGGSAPSTAPSTKWWVSTFADAPGYGGGWLQVGTLYAGTNYVYCKEVGSTISDSAGDHNDYWLWTDLDTGGQGWVSAYYLSLWGNDVAKDNSGNVIPTC